MKRLSFMNWGGDKGGCCNGSRSFFQMNGESIEIKDYKISSSKHGGTELEVVFEFEGDFTEFLSKVNSTDGKS